MRVLLISNGSASAGTARLFADLWGRLSHAGKDAQFIPRDLPRGALPKLFSLICREWPILFSVWSSRVLLIHTSAALNVLPVLMAKLLGRRVVVFGWDVYPDSLPRAGSFGSASKWVFRWIERTVLALADEVAVPSEDYEQHFAKVARNCRTVPIWATDPWRDWPALPPLDTTLRVAFAGQVNGARGVSEAIRVLGRLLPDGTHCQLDLFSRDPMPASEMSDVGPAVEIKWHGHLGSDELSTALAECHFGLVALRSDFPWPAYPSKLANYVSAGLPVLYHGPSLPALEADIHDFHLGLVLDEAVLVPEALEQVRANFILGREAYRRNVERAVTQFVEDL